jgi:hypothetical protein
MNEPSKNTPANGNGSAPADGKGDGKGGTGEGAGTALQALIRKRKLAGQADPRDTDPPHPVPPATPPT